MQVSDNENRDKGKVSSWSSGTEKEADAGGIHCHVPYIPEWKEAARKDKSKGTVFIHSLFQSIQLRNGERAACSYRVLYIYMHVGGC